MRNKQFLETKPTEIEIKNATNNSKSRLDVTNERTSEVKDPSEWSRRQQSDKKMENIAETLGNVEKEVKWPRDLRGRERGRHGRWLASQCESTGQSPAWMYLQNPT